MRIGYPCINWTLECKGDRTFRLKSYSEDLLTKTVQNNLSCLLEILRFNAKHRLLFFRITSDLVPFASHPICKFNWKKRFKNELRAVGDFIKKTNMRISMHPDQFTLINSLNTKIFERSKRELTYHSQVLDLMELDNTAKIQMHVGGVYGDKEKSINRFIERFRKIDENTKKRLAIENDDRLYNLKNCLQLTAETGIPVLFDAFHHELNSSGESVKDAFKLFTKTWKKKDGLPMVDYSSEKSDNKKRRHADSIDLTHFRNFLEKTKPFDFDLMLEIKDKEKSALKAVEAASEDDRFLAAT